eukprot:355266-Chlamydomonas_euryale.AAC.4
MFCTLHWPALPSPPSRPFFSPDPTPCAWPAAPRADGMASAPRSSLRLLPNQQRAAADAGGGGGGARAGSLGGGVGVSVGGAYMGSSAAGQRKLGKCRQTL